MSFPPAPPETPAEGLTQRSLRGGAWILSRSAFARVLGVGAVAVLARHLSPADFGVVALAQVLIFWISALGQAGVGSFVILDRDEGWERRADAAFWMNAALTAGQVAVAAALIPLALAFYGNSSLGPVLAVLVGVLVLQQTAVVPDALVRRRLEYRALALRDSALDVVSSACSVGLAVAGYGVWSLVAPQVAASALRLGLTLRVARWLPSRRLGLGEWPRIFRFSGHVLGQNVLGMALNDGDTLLVGKLFGAQALGVYNLAWQLANLVGRNVTTAVSAVALPAMSAVQHSRERLQAGYLRMLALLSVAVFPALCGLFAVAGDAVALVYGPRWAASVPLLRILVAFTLVRAVTSPTASVYALVGRPELGTRINLATVPVYLAAIVAGSRWGLTGVAVGVAAVRIVGGPRRSWCRC
ncbi:MAG TPA: lipopolysaccharide biosynthesis protein, partial [Longimicrobium sp.]|nr:lipopolysaccharide biosynthesis protein [Longimicrobium sp.]